MRRFGRLAVAVAMTAAGIIVGAGTGGPASAETAPARRSALAELTGADLATLLETIPQVFCGNRVFAYNSPSSNSPTKCVNGAENSGNSTNSGNYYSEGNPVNSGNFSNGNGATGSNNATSSGNAANGMQSLDVGGGSAESPEARQN